MRAQSSRCRIVFAEPIRAQSVRARSVVLNRNCAKSCRAWSIPSRKRSPWKKIAPEKRSREKKSPDQKSSGEKIPGKMVPEKAFSVEGMTIKFTEGSWTIFLFRSIDPTRLPHTHQTVRTGVRGPFFRGLFTEI